MPSAWDVRLLLERYEPGASAALECAHGRLCRRPMRVEGGRLLDQSRALTERFGPIAQGKRIVVDAGELAFHWGTPQETVSTPSPGAAAEESLSVLSADVERMTRRRLVRNDWSV